MQRRRPGVVRIDQSWGKRQEVRDQEGYPRVGDERFERRVSADAVDLDVLTGLDKRQQADLRMPSVE